MYMQHLFLLLLHHLDLDPARKRRAISHVRGISLDRGSRSLVLGRRRTGARFLLMFIELLAKETLQK
jgi:hypothetical protein